ncbi:MAG: hypothetical protein DI533_14130 [Cereibacter sphaeroides]|uniref:Uncharacterized protein n=1 Tax=Cereibacter sphaeroides TaxID=1063 RepID=A0A2W5S9J0_CERSP|nr:MAG: hypothetical protein DI533_14130 [Cereibacter sphaeroides]
MAVEQNSDFLNEFARAGEAHIEDAQQTWALIARCISEQRDLPRSAKCYLAKVAAFAMTFERSPSRAAERSDSDRLADALGFYREREYRPSKATLDGLEVFSTVTRWRRQGNSLSLEECFERYINELLDGDGEEQTIKTSYYRGKAMAEAEIELSGMIIARGSLSV